jgi:hypothetical protein
MEEKYPESRATGKANNIAKGEMFHVKQGRKTAYFFFKLLIFNIFPAKSVMLG